MYAGDEKGFLHIIDVYDEAKIITKNLRSAQSKSPLRINKLEIIGPQECRCLLVLTDY